MRSTGRLLLLLSNWTISRPGWNQHVRLSLITAAPPVRLSDIITCQIPHASQPSTHDITGCHFPPLMTSPGIQHWAGGDVIIHLQIGFTLICGSFLCAVHCGRAASISLNTHTHTHTPPHHRWFKHFNDESFKLWNMFWVLFWFHFFVFLMNYFINANTWRNFLTMQLISFFLSKPKFMSLLSVQLVTQCSGSLLRVIKPLWTHIPSCRPRNSREAALWPVNAVKLCGQSSGTKLHSEKEKIGCFCFLARFCWRTNTTRTSISLHLSPAWFGIDTSN